MSNYEQSNINLSLTYLLVLFLLLYLLFNNGFLKHKLK